MEFEQREDGTIEREGTVLDRMDPVRVRGLCLSCTHQWTIRGAHQIVNLPGHPDYEKYATVRRRVK